MDFKIHLLFQRLLSHIPADNHPPTHATVRPEETGFPAAGTRVRIVVRTVVILSQSINNLYTNKLLRMVVNNIMLWCTQTAPTRPSCKCKRTNSHSWMFRYHILDIHPVNQLLCNMSTTAVLAAGRFIFIALPSHRTSLVAAAATPPHPSRPVLKERTANSVVWWFRGTCGLWWPNQDVFAAPLPEILFTEQWLLGRRDTFLVCC